MAATQRETKTLNEASFYNLTNVYFKKFFGLSLEDAGLGEALLVRGFSDLSPRDAALEAGYAYDLDRVDVGWR